MVDDSIRDFHILELNSFYFFFPWTNYVRILIVYRTRHEQLIYSSLLMTQLVKDSYLFH